MQIPKELTTVTTVSKTVALVMFVTLPIIAFLFGMRYQTLIEQANSMPPAVVVISPKITYTCPKKQYVNCMPGPDKIKKTECTSEFLQWAQANCPNFKGVAY